MKRAAILRQLEKAETRYWEEVGEILAERVQPVVEMYCRRYRRQFLSGNGTWWLSNPAHEPDAFTWRRGERVSFSHLEALLDAPVDRMNDIGSLLEDYTPGAPHEVAE